MSKKAILDAFALMAFLEKEPGYEKVKAIFISAAEKNDKILMSAVNFGEVYYIVFRECGEKKALEIEKLLHSLPIEIVSVDYQLAKIAAFFKAQRKMSYADCFAAALAKVHKGEIITGDPEFKEIEKEIKINWI